jgi:methylated-DNA-[protein]-cysteine S-methyltransferase
MKTIPFGGLRSYGDMATAIGSSARAVGTACGRNPIPIIVPCHRVIATGGSIGGYSGRGGLETKRALLILEGVVLA